MSYEPISDVINEQSAWLSSQTSGSSSTSSTEDGSFSETLDEILSDQEEEEYSVTANVNGTSVSTSEVTGDRSSSLFEPKKTLGVEDYMQLMITEMQNQDPLSAAESNTDYISKIAQFTAMETNTNILTAINNLTEVISNQDDNGDVVQAINDLHETVKSSSTNNASSGITVSDGMSAVALIGKDVRVLNGATETEEDGEPIQLRVHNESDNLLNLVIKDSEGNTVNTIPLRGTDTDGAEGFNANGDGIYTWDGTDEDGNTVEAGLYTFKLENDDGSTVSGFDCIFSEGKVNGLTYVSGEAVLTVLDDETGEENQVYLSSLIQVNS